MLKRILSIFARDLKVNSREFITLYIIIIPVVMAVGINFISPGINDTTVNLALIKDENPGQADYFGDFAHVGLFDDRKEAEDRIMARDDVVGVLPDGRLSLEKEDGTRFEAAAGEIAMAYNENSKIE